MTHLKIACAVVALSSLVTVAVIGRSSPPDVEPVVYDATQPTPLPLMDDPEMVKARAELGQKLKIYTEPLWPTASTDPVIRTPESLTEKERNYFVIPPPKQATAADEKQHRESKVVTIDHGPCLKNPDRKRKVWINPHQWRCMK